MSKMKMSDVFYTDDFNIMHQAEIVDTSKYAYIEHNEIQIEGEAHINHAVRNHDRMAEEIAELREILERLIDSENCKKDIIHIIGSAESLLNQKGEE